MPSRLMEANIESVARAIPRRSRVARDITAVYRLPILIEDVRRDELVHCASLAGKPVMAWGGRLWGRLVNTGWAARSVGKAVDATFLQVIFNGIDKMPGYSFARAPLEPEWLAYQTIEDDGIAAAEKAAAICAAGFIICEEEVWATYKVPDLALALGRGYVTLMASGERVSQAIFPFRLQDLDAARSIGVDIAQKIGVTLRDCSPPLVFHRLDLIPMKPAIDLSVELAAIPARFVESLAHLKSDDMRIWIDFRSACAGGNAEAACQSLLDLVTVVLERARICADCNRLATEIAVLMVGLCLWCAHHHPDDAGSFLSIADALEWRAEAVAA